MGSALVGSNPIGVALLSGTNVFVPKHVRRNTKLLSIDFFDATSFHLVTVTVAILAQGRSLADAATHAFCVFSPPTFHKTCGITET